MDMAVANNYNLFWNITSGFWSGTGKPSDLSAAPIFRVKLFHAPSG